MFIPVLLFIVGLFLLIKGGDIFVDSSVGIARRFGLSELVIGATVVSLGTTLPEVMVSVTSALEGHGELSYGNAVGSVICNTALIAAISITVRPQKIDSKTFRVPVIFFFISAVFYALNAYIFGYFNRISGILLLAMFLLYMIFNIVSAKNEGSGQQLLTTDNLHGDDNIVLIKNIIFLVVGALIIALGADLLVDNGILIAQYLGVPESVVALTFVALGTSLPELVTSVTSLVKGHGDLSLGNIIGANLLNLVFVSGLSVTLSPFDVPSSQQLFGQPSSLILDIPLMFIVMAILTLPAVARGKLSRIQGIILLLIYAAFCTIQFSV